MIVNINIDYNEKNAFNNAFCIDKYAYFRSGTILCKGTR